MSGGVRLGLTQARDLMRTAKLGEDDVYRFPSGALVPPSLFEDAGVEMPPEQREAWTAQHSKKPLTRKRERAMVPNPALRPENREPGQDTMSDTNTEKRGPTFTKERLASYTKGKTGALNNGDAIANALDEFLSSHDKGDARRAAMSDVAEANGIDVASFAHLNNGGFRMAVGGALRTAARHGKTVKIGKAKIDAATLGVEVVQEKPKAEKAAKAPAAPKAAEKPAKPPQAQKAPAPAKAAAKPATKPAAKSKAKGK